MKSACQDCVFWDQSRENEFTGFCRRYAPSHPTPSARTVNGVHLTELWPVTARGAWCGEFEAQPAEYPERPAQLSFIFLAAKAVTPLTDVLEWVMICTRATDHPQFNDKQITRSLSGNPWILAQSFYCGQPVTLAMQVVYMELAGDSWRLVLHPNVSEAEWRAYTDVQRQRYRPSEALLLVEQLPEEK